MEGRRRCFAQFSLMPPLPPQADYCWVVSSLTCVLACPSNRPSRVCWLRSGGHAGGERTPPRHMHQCSAHGSAAVGRYAACGGRHESSHSLNMRAVVSFSDTGTALSVGSQSVLSDFFSGDGFPAWPSAKIFSRADWRRKVWKNVHSMGTEEKRGGHFSKPDQFFPHEKRFWRTKQKPTDSGGGFLGFTGWGGIPARVC